jgi:hypothetical protein
VPEYSGRIPTHDHIRGYIFSDDRAGFDNDIVSNLDSWTNDDLSTNPAIIPYRHGESDIVVFWVLRTAEERPSVLRIQRMGGRVDMNAWGETAVVSNTDGSAIQKETV